jgi:hypothetical protein
MAPGSALTASTSPHVLLFQYLCDYVLRSPGGLSVVELESSNENMIQDPRKMASGRTKENV